MYNLLLLLKKYRKCPALRTHTHNYSHLHSFDNEPLWIAGWPVAKCRRRQRWRPFGFVVVFRDVVFHVEAGRGPGGHHVLQHLHLFSGWGKQQFFIFDLLIFSGWEEKKLNLCKNFTMLYKTLYKSHHHLENVEFFIQWTCNWTSKNLFWVFTHLISLSVEALAFANLATTCGPSNQSWALSVFLNFFTNKKWFFAFFIKLIWLGVGFLNRTGAEIGY